MFVINVAGGGTKPPELDGSFTNFDNAKHAIKFYVDTHVGEIELVDTNDRSAVPMVSETEEFPDAIPE